MKTKTRSNAALRMTCGLALVLGSTACLPTHLDKYRKKSGSQASAPTTHSTGVEDPMLPRTQDQLDQEARDKAGDAPAAPAPSRAATPETVDRRQATIFAVDKHTFRFALREPEVWDSALNVLMRNYNLTIVDRSSGVVTTEWDSYYLDKDVYRNRVSLRVVKAGRDGVELTIVNNVERLRDASQATGGMGAVWLPAEDRGSEIARIIQNMALVLNQPPPVLPPRGAIAKGQGESIDQSNR